MNVNKNERGAALVAVQPTRTVRVYAITEQEAGSVDHQYLMASALFACGTFCAGVLTNIWLCSTEINLPLAVALAVGWAVFWSIGGWQIWVRHSLLKTLRRESGVEPMPSEGMAGPPP